MKDDIFDLTVGIAFTILIALVVYFIGAGPSLPSIECHQHCSQIQRVCEDKEKKTLTDCMELYLDCSKKCKELWEKD